MKKENRENMKEKEKKRKQRIIIIKENIESLRKIKELTSHGKLYNEIKKKIKQRNMKKTLKSEAN